MNIQEKRDDGDLEKSQWEFKCFILEPRGQVFSSLPVTFEESTWSSKYGCNPPEPPLNWSSGSREREEVLNVSKFIPLTNSVSPPPARSTQWQSRGPDRMANQSHTVKFTQFFVIRNLERSYFISAFI